LRLQGKPLDREARDYGSEPFDSTGEIFADSRGVAFDYRHSRKVTPKYRDEAWLALEGNDPVGWTACPHEAAGQTAGSRAEFEHRPRPLEIGAARKRVGEPWPARIRRRYSQRLLQPKAKKDRCIRGHVITHSDRPMGHSSSCMLQFFEPHMWNYLRKTVISAW
jgi:hypothetical protein